MLKKALKILGAAGAAALVAGCVPYHFENDKETGHMEIGGLLWNLTKTAGKEEDTYVMELLPFVGKEKDEAPAEEETVEVETPAAEEEAAPEIETEEDKAEEEPFVEEVSSDVVVESVDTASEATEEPFAEEAEVEVEVEESK